MLKRPQNTVKSRFIGYRATQAQIKAIEQAAKRDGKLSVSEWMREIVEKAIETPCV